MDSQNVDPKPSTVTPEESQPVEANELAAVIAERDRLACGSRRALAADDAPRDEGCADERAGELGDRVDEQPDRDGGREGPGRDRDPRQRSPLLALLHASIVETRPVQSLRSRDKDDRQVYGSPWFLLITGLFVMALVVSNATSFARSSLGSIASTIYFPAAFSACSRSSIRSCGSSSPIESLIVLSKMPSSARASFDNR